MGAIPQSLAFHAAAHNLGPLAFFFSLFSVFSCTEAIYCRYGEPIATCVQRSSFEHVATTNQAKIHKTVESRPLASHEQSSTPYFKPQPLPGSDNKYSIHWTLSHPPLRPSSPVTFPPKAPETLMLFQDYYLIPSLQFQGASLSNIPHRPLFSNKLPYLIDELFGRPLPPLLGIKPHLNSQNLFPYQKERSKTLNIHANNVYVNLNGFRLDPDALGFEGPLDSKGSHRPMSLMAIFNKPEKSYTQSYLEAQNNGQDGHLGEHESSSMVHPLINILYRYFMEQGKDGTHRLDTTSSLYFPLNLKPTESQSGPEPNIPSKLITEQHSDIDKSGEAIGLENTETTSSSGESFNPFLRIDEYFDTHKNLTGWLYSKQNNVMECQGSTTIK